MEKAAIIKEHQQALTAPGNLHAVGKQHLGGRCRWCKQDGKVQEEKKVQQKWKHEKKNLQIQKCLKTLSHGM